MVTVFSDKIVDKIVSKSLLTYVTSVRKIHQKIFFFVLSPFMDLSSLIYHEDCPTKKAS